jgi:hypothetical protein
MIWALIAAAVNRAPQGEPVFIRCARCAAISDVPMRISSVTTFRPGRPLAIQSACRRADRMPENPPP